MEYVIITGRLIYTIGVTSDILTLSRGRLCYSITSNIMYSQIIEKCAVVVLYFVSETLPIRRGG
jgi:hypothetical protein